MFYLELVLKVMKGNTVTSLIACPGGRLMPAMVRSVIWQLIKVKSMPMFMVLIYTK